MSEQPQKGKTPLKRVSGELLDLNENRLNQLCKCPRSALNVPYQRWSSTSPRRRA